MGVSLQPPRTVSSLAGEGEMTASGLVIPDNAKEKPQEGEVLGLPAWAASRTATACPSTSRSATRSSTPSTAAPRSSWPGTSC